MNCQRWLVCLSSVLLVAGVACAASDDILAGPQAKAARGFTFSPADQKLLDEVQHACFLYFWKEVGEPACLVKDRLKAPVASIAAVGFQLSSLPIGVERGWVERAAAEQRAVTLLRSVLERKDNRKFGVLIHFPDHNTAGLSASGFETEASTVDHSLFLAGAITAAQYFGGETARLTDQFLAETNWKAYAVAKDGFLSMGWKPDEPGKMEGPGKFIEWSWHDNSDEERLIYFIAAGATNEDHAIAPELYYRLGRPIQRHRDMRPYVVSYPGTLFTYFFSHCWIDYGRLGPDDPSRFGVAAPRVDWFENSRRAMLTHRQRCIELAQQYPTLSEERWGLSACAARDGYIVPEVQPNLRNRDEVFEGTIAPYAAACAILFTPAESLAAIRAFRELKRPDGEPFVWRDPSTGGYGFVDSFNLSQDYACDDYTGIDHGPMLLAIENARSGLIWKLFMGHSWIQRATKRLQLGE